MSIILPNLKWEFRVRFTFQISFHLPRNTIFRHNAAVICPATKSPLKEENSLPPQDINTFIYTFAEKRSVSVCIRQCFEENFVVHCHCKGVVRLGHKILAMHLQPPVLELCLPVVVLSLQSVLPKKIINLSYFYLLFFLLS